jgi:hypothetical protein
VQNLSGVVTVNGVTIQNNSVSSSTGTGGGFRNLGGTLNISSTIIQNNTVNATNGLGAGFYNEAATAVMISSSTIRNGTSTVARNGAGIYIASGSMTISNTSFISNKASNLGGAAFLAGGTLTISNSRFEGNTATSQGGAIANYATLKLSGSHLTGNNGTNFGGAIVSNTTTTTVIIQNNCIYGNTATNGSGVYSFVANLNATNNWWGSVNGPLLSGSNPNVDSVNSNVVYTPYKNDGCPGLPTPTPIPTQTHTPTLTPTGTILPTETSTPTITPSLTPSATLPSNLTCYDWRAGNAYGWQKSPWYTGGNVTWAVGGMSATGGTTAGVYLARPSGSASWKLVIANNGAGTFTVAQGATAPTTSVQLSTTVNAQADGTYLLTDAFIEIRWTVNATTPLVFYYVCMSAVSGTATPTATITPSATATATITPTGSPNLQGLILREYGLTCTPSSTGFCSESIYEGYVFHDNYGRGNYGFTFEGCIRFPTSEDYRFYLSSDDGSILWIYDTETVAQPLIDIWWDHWVMTRVSYFMPFQTEKNYHFLIQFYQGPSYRAYLNFEWESASIPRQQVPPQYYFYSPDGGDCTQRPTVIYPTPTPSATPTVGPSNTPVGNVATDFTFNSCTLNGWIQVSGDAFSALDVTNDTVSTYPLPLTSAYENFNQPGGSCHLSGYKDGGGRQIGEIRSQLIRIDASKRYISAWISGGGGSTGYVAVVRASDNVILFQASGNNSEMYQKVYWDAQVYYNTDVYIRIVDNLVSSYWGHINVDDITFSSALPPTSTPPPTPLPTATATPPLAAPSVPGCIQSPVSQSIVSGQVGIVLNTGVSYSNLRVEYWPTSSVQLYRPLSSQSTSSGGTAIATLDTTLLANDSYVIRVVGTAGGVGVNCNVLVKVTGDNKPGRVTFTTTDFTVPIVGLPITILVMVGRWQLVHRACNAPPAPKMLR